ncbi:MAG: fibronectin type III domain-containing protein [Pseudomonadota bacterium]
MLVSAHYAYAAQVTLAWDPNTEPDLAGYTIYYGNAGSAYEYSVNAGNQTEYTLAELEDGMTYYFAVKARDIYGNESAYSNEVSWTSPFSNEPRVEAGEITIDHNWAYVPFDQPFSDPIVVAKVMTYNDSAPCVARICNVDGAGFEIRIQEWDYLDDVHGVESVSYIAMERGSYTLSNGTVVEAGQFQIQNAGSFQSVTFDGAFQVTPVVVASVSSFNEEDAPTGRLRNISPNGFEFMLQEQGLNAGEHAPETISYIAWEPSVGSLGGLTFEVNRTGDVMTNNFNEIVFEENFTELPAFFADMQTTDGGDTASVRAQGRAFFNVQVKIEEEQSADSEIAHTTEVVGYMVFGASD